MNTLPNKKSQYTIYHIPYTACGFTLVELLIVMSLIGVLATISIVSFRTATMKGRDTQRKSDIKQYQTSLEMYANLTSGLFPTSSNVRASTTLCGYLNNQLEPDISCSEDPKYVQDNTFVYRYISNGAGGGGASATNYVLWGKLESYSPIKYWIVCSNGKAGESTSAPNSSTCPI
ncbi:MAG: type II secretion system protein [Patescibacteria group bacterium]